MQDGDRISTDIECFLTEKSSWKVSAMMVRSLAANVY